jgi:hypothetical protein
MYKQYLKVVESGSGKGVFTTIEIPANMPITEANGPVHVEKEVPTDPNILQIGPETYMAVSGHLLPDYINHSCDPNCRFEIVGNRAILYSLYVIPVNAELTFDYSTTSTETYDTWRMECACGSSKCRKVISGYQYLTPTLQEEYKKKRMIPMFITYPFQKK